MKINQSMWNGFKLVMIRTYHKNAIKEYKTSNKELIICGSIGRILKKKTNWSKAPDNIVEMEFDLRNNEGLHPFYVCFSRRCSDSCIAILNENYLRDRKFDADGNPIGDTDELYIEKPFGNGEWPIQQGWNMTFDELSNLLESHADFFRDNYLGEVGESISVS